MAASTPTPTTYTEANRPFPQSTMSSSTPIHSGSSSHPSASITSFSTLVSASPSSNGTFNSTATTSSASEIFVWSCHSSGREGGSLFENFSGCTYAQSSTPTARPSNGTNGTISGGMPAPTGNSGVRVATGVEFGSVGALALVFVAMLGWL